MQDPFVLLDRLAKNGLESVAIQIKFDGKPVTITDVSLEVALSGEIPEGLDPEAREAIAASLFLVELDQEGEYDIRQKAAAGQETAQRAYQAIVLRELVKLRTIARRLVQKFKAGDPKARAGVKWIFDQALRPGPGQGRARTCVYLLRDAKRELEAAQVAQNKTAGAADSTGSHPPPQESAAPAPTEGVRDVSARPVTQEEGIRP